MKPTRVKVRPYRHSATAKWVVTWCTGSRPHKDQVAAWDAKHAHAKPEDRARFIAGTWQRHRKFFQERSEADTFADGQRTKLVNEGTRALAIPDELRVMAARCAERLKPYGYTIEQAVEHFIEHVKTTRRSVTVSALVKEYAAAKKQKGNKERSLKDIAHRLKIFGHTFGERIVATITTAEVDDWLTSLGLSAQSQNNYRAVARAFFEHAMKRDYTPANPVARIDKVRIADKPAAIFKPDELEELLTAAGEIDAATAAEEVKHGKRRTPETLPVLVIGAFAGLRMAEIFRLDWSEVDLARGFIEVKASKSKTAQRRLVTIQPNLRAWLAPFADRKGPVWPGKKPGAHGGESNWRVKLEPVREAAELTEWPENGLRHSFGSYHLAKHGNANALALEMGHTTTKEIFAHYREVVRPDDAERYWNIRPAAPANVVPMEAVAS